MILPITILNPKLRGRNARNNPFRIELNPRAPYPAAIWAQELWEARQKMKFWQGMGRQLRELMGHEVEVQAAVRFYDVSEPIYRRHEARAMAMHAPYGFKITSAEIENLMKQRSAKAAAWVARHQDEIAKMKAKIEASL